MVAPTMTGTNARKRASRTEASALRELRERAVAVKQDARDLAASAGAVAREQFDPIKEYIAQKPLNSVLIAGAIGLCLGFFFRRR